MNGKVTSYGLGKPMDWRTFKSMPIDIQSEYLMNLRKAFSVNTIKLGEMFGVRGVTVRKHIREFAIAFPVSKGNRMKPHEKEAWSQFLSGKAALPDGPNAAEAGRLPVPDAREPCCAPHPQAAGMESFSISFSGHIDTAAISNSLLGMLGKGATGRIEITYTRDTAHG